MDQFKENIFSDNCYLQTCIQTLSAKNETSVSPNSSRDAAIMGPRRENTGHLGPFGLHGDHTLYPSNVYAPQAQAFYYRG